MNASVDDMNKQTHKEADASKLDLNQQSASVPGSEAVAPGTQRDPFGDRKALFAKHAAKQHSESKTIQDNNPGLKEKVQMMEAESRGGDPVVSQPAQTLQNESQSITITNNGRQFTVPRRDIEKAGGEAGYLRQLQADDMDARLAEQAAEMQRRKAELDAQDADLKRRQEDFIRSQTGVQGAPANSDDGTSSQGSRPADSADNLEAEARAMVEKLFSGDPADAESVIKQIIAQSRHLPTLPTADQLAELAAAKLRQTQPKQEPQQEQPAVDPRWERTRLSINEMAAREYPTLANDPQLAFLARNEINRLLKEPANKDRRVVDVAREACGNVQAELNRQARVAVKQGLPAVPTAGGAAPQETDETIATGSNYVALMADRRNFGTRNRQ